MVELQENAGGCEENAEEAHRRPFTFRESMTVQSRKMLLLLSLCVAIVINQDFWSTHVCDFSGRLLISVNLFMPGNIQ